MVANWDEVLSSCFYRLLEPKAVDNVARSRDQCEELEPHLREVGVMAWENACLSAMGRAMLWTHTDSHRLCTY